MANYVYGIVEASAKAPPGEGIAGSALRLIKDDSMAALVSDVAREELKLGREELLVHARVLEAALAQGTVLPMRFGMVMEGPEDIRGRLLSEHAADLREQLDDLSGKVEMRVRAVYREEALMSEIVREDRDVARLRESLRGVSEDATYYGRITLGELVAQAVERKRALDSRHVLDVLTPFAVAVEMSDPPHERVAVNASFLVKRTQLRDFDDALEGLAEAQASRMTVKLTGPLPPHSFVRLGGGG